ncbi:hypothetical protein IMSHALPRED_001785 [Imshaugia aleurites]|uniref:Uncharacterized protein n=1 Tax=Imshaugia aleurites TaxID=172621 RepID=A0A8H3J3S5_9LECA|nr:hypothetical protein IMSHALPRED_001785 [Imshaugia aleurites]
MPGPKEDAMLVWLSYQGLNLRDIEGIMADRLNRYTRNDVPCFRRIERINEIRAAQGLAPLCDPPQLDWNRAAVESFLIPLINDTNQLAQLLVIDQRHIPLITSVRPGTASLS